MSITIASVKPILLTIFLSLFVSLAGMSLSAAELKVNANKKGIMINGYDTVAYHLQSKAIKGSSDFALEHAGKTWHFSSAANRDAFKDNPDKFKPYYGGWCAYAMADGEYVEIDPKRYLITDGKLYLFYNGFWGDTLPKWQKDEKNLMTKADKAWAAIVSKAQ